MKPWPSCRLYHTRTLWAVRGSSLYLLLYHSSVFWARLVTMRKSERRTTVYRLLTDTMINQ